MRGIGFVVEIVSWRKLELLKPTEFFGLQCDEVAYEIGDEVIASAALKSEPHRNFRLMFAPSRIEELAARYSFQGDTDALKAGQEIQGGRYTRENMERIFNWKTNGRGRSRLTNNTDEEISPPGLFRRGF
jgi:hypothetical protein